MAMQVFSLINTIFNCNHHLSCKQLSFRIKRTAVIFVVVQVTALNKSYQAQNKPVLQYYVSQL